MIKYTYSTEDYTGRNLDVTIGTNTFNSVYGKGTFYTSKDGITSVLIDENEYKVYELAENFYYCEEMDYSRASETHPVIAALKMAHFVS